MEILAHWWSSGDGRRGTGRSAGVVVARYGAVRWNEGMEDVWCCGATTWFGSSTSLLCSANLFPLAWPRRKIKVQVGECEWVAAGGFGKLTHEPRWSPVPDCLWFASPSTGAGGCYGLP